MIRLNHEAKAYPLPSAYRNRMQALLESEAHDYFCALQQPFFRGIRFNPRKPLSSKFLPQGIGKVIPWARNAFYLSAESDAGARPLHDAGAYYLQEPSAMIPATVLRPRPGENILDLCAAPGGKSTQLADYMSGEGLLVCNEPVPSRALTLSRNIERMGISNALVVSAQPDALARKWPQTFDAILVDAPCSGEGMFRRHPQARSQWKENTVTGCATRQLHILQSAHALLKPGGRLVYSTCTFSPQENEEVVLSLLQSFPDLIPASFSVPIEDDHFLHSTNGMLRLYPHQIHGEGHFVALLHKQSSSSQPSPCFQTASQALAMPTKAQMEAFQCFEKKLMHPLPLATAALGDMLLNAPLLPSLKGMKVLRAGVHLGILKGKVFVPDHSLALLPSATNFFCTHPISEEQAMAFQRGETITGSNLPHGYALLSLNGISLGFAKGSDNQLKNHYPKGLRRPLR